ncbi:cytochrome b5 reductase 4-like [Cylas formicarius]|uniref:cytochrome b5 reductase 4-like n=1 Tax=Cylas formicarius TaxID=197179 RepID=UPI002958BC87|nr:cytochrome b5 reductase 4-like isoform X2 [Cylas formicarius]XP_060521616.1 cytochrome b5 reductase 4-like isoform X2 [Cylas formicarius]XP_060521617.1 cytochrome b5 reductase 4-like isoform X2 [Cylas formicarius]XP_060521618.1 cytochrome b5 reductase 4-like isoform X2 [Cylas formicarius]XP_060521883.1 cytochrome b5 reductase 4-like [Cylas formicarius]
MLRTFTSCFCWSSKTQKDDDTDNPEKDDVRNGDDIFRIEDNIAEREYRGGNPRNKCALQPGHSLMDWIRLGSSGKDLTGLGPNAGTLSVTKQELAKHNKKNDAWLAIRGRVYNVTAYLPFHPGGEEELMRGAGIDATHIFNEVHPWVNYEQILQKCVVGKLVSMDPSIDAGALFFGERKSTASPNQLIVSPTIPKNNSPPKKIDVDSRPEETLDQILSLPRFDWIQKLDYITIIFYTKAFSNPLVEIQPPLEDKNVAISITYDDTLFKNEVSFYDKVTWPCDVNVAIETGKVELVFKKFVGNIWDHYGVLKQQSKATSSMSASQIKYSYALTKKLQVNYNTLLLKFEKTDNGKLIVPLGKHIRVFGDINGNEISRSYTPVPDCLFDRLIPHKTTKETICLLVKRYMEGNISRFVTDRQIDDIVQFSRPLGNFQLKHVEKKETFLFLAAGTGITPMLSLILFLLERRVKKCQFIRLLFFNRSEKDILLKSHFENLSKEDPRFRIEHVLSEPSSKWTGPTGHVNQELVENALQEHLQDTGYTIKDIYAVICGPCGFNSAAVDVLLQIGLEVGQVHKFEG